MSLKGNSNAEKIWNFLLDKGLSATGAAALMGNLKAESNLNPQNLQNTYERSLGMSDAQYTAAVDNGSYTNFVHDGAGYGLAQWTYYSRKQKMLDFHRKRNASIGDLETQLEFLYVELGTSYLSLLNALMGSTDLMTLSTKVLTQFEKPANQSESVQRTRASYGQEFYDTFANSATTKNQENGDDTMSKRYASTVIGVAVTQIGYKEKKSNSQLDDKTANAGSANYTKYARDFDQKYPNWYNGKKNGFAWCDMFVDWCFLTAFGYSAALKLLCQQEKSAGAGCTYSLSYYRNKGQFHTSNPKPGDQIFFGTSISNSSHTGIVEKVDSKNVYTIEGNTSDMVARRTYALTSSKIIGYGRPAYDAEVTVVPSQTPVDTKPATSLNIKIGDTVKFIGTKHYASTNATSGPAAKACEAKVTGIYASGKHPYHLIGSGVYGWVDASDIQVPTSAATTSLNYGTAAPAQNFDKSLAGTYTVKASDGLNMRVNAGTANSIITTIPNGSKVQCYGYYNMSGTTKWLYVVYNGKVGYCSSKYLSK